MISPSLAMKLCGFLYIFILVTNAAGVGLGNRNDETDFDSKLLTVSGNPGRYRMSLFVTIGSHLGIVAITVMLYLAFSSYNREYALIGSVFRMGEALVMIYSEVSVFRVLDYAREYVLPESNKEALRLTFAQIMQMKNIRVDMGLLLLSIGAVAYCILFIQSASVPSRIAWLGLSAGVISGIGIVIKLFSGFSTLSLIGMVLMMIFEVTFGGWLMFLSGSRV